MHKEGILHMDGMSGLDTPIGRVRSQQLFRFEEQERAQYLSGGVSVDRDWKERRLQTLLPSLLMTARTRVRGPTASLSSQTISFSKPSRPASPGLEKLHLARPQSLSPGGQAIRPLPRYVCLHNKSRAAAAPCCAAQIGHDEHDKPYDEANPAHRALLWVFRRTGLLRAWELLEDRLWVAGLVFALGCAAGAAQGLAAVSQLQMEVAYRIACTATWATYLLSGLPALVELSFDLTAGRVDTHVLMTLAVLGTLGMGHAGEGALLLALFNISHTLEHYLTERAQGDMSSLFDQVPACATLVQLRRDGTPDLSKESSVPTASLAIGSHMLVRPGEQVPVDGQVVHGRSLVSMEHITGEAMPAPRGPGDDLPAGARNHDGALVMRSLRASDDSTPARIARLTLAAQGTRPQLGKWLDSFGSVYSKAVLVATAATLLLLPLAGVPLLDTPSQRGAVYRAMGVLTVASPCALVVVPSAYIAAIACTSFRGMLVKGGRVLDALVRCSTVALDKTGTLTRGQLACTSMLSLEQQPFAPPRHPAGERTDAWVRRTVQQGRQDDITALGAAIALSLRSRHPVSESVTALRAAAGPSLPVPDIDDFHLEAGSGVQGTVQWQGRRCTAVFGSSEFVCQGLADAHGLTVAAAAGRLSRSGSVSVLVLRHDSTPALQQPSLIRFFTFADMVHAQSLAAVQALQSGRWRKRHRRRDELGVVMLTGDTEASARRIAEATGIQHFSAGLSPEQKLQAIQQARQGAKPQPLRGPGVIMVGDGINDAPALAAADVGVAVTGALSDAAGATADVLLLRGDGIAGLPILLSIAQRTQTILKQNLVLAIGSIAVLALPMLLGIIPLWIAVACHEGSTLLVVLNSLRLLRAPDVPTTKAPKPDLQEQPSHIFAPVSASTSGSSGASSASPDEQHAAMLVKIDPLVQQEAGALAGFGSMDSLAWPATPASAA